MPATVAVIIQPTRCISCTDVFQVSGPQSLRRRVMECGCSLCPFCSEKLKLTKLVACPVCSYQYKYTQGQEDWFHHSVTPADIAAQESRCQSVRNEIRAVQGSINDLTASEPSSDDDYSAIVRHVRVIEEREAEAKRQQEAAEAADIAAAAAAAEEEGKGNNGDGAVGALDMNGMRVHDDEDEDEDEDPLVDDDDDHHGDLDDPLNDDEGNGGEEEEKESEEQPPEKIKVKLLQEVILSDSSIDITSEDLDDDYSNTRYAIVTNRLEKLQEMLQNMKGKYGYKAQQAHTLIQFRSTMTARSRSSNASSESVLRTVSLADKKKRRVTRRKELTHKRWLRLLSQQDTTLYVPPKLVLKKDKAKKKVADEESDGDDEVDPEEEEKERQRKLKKRPLPPKATYRERWERKFTRWHSITTSFPMKEKVYKARVELADENRNSDKATKLKAKLGVLQMVNEITLEKVKAQMAKLEKDTQSLFGKFGSKQIERKALLDWANNLFYPPVKVQNDDDEEDDDY